MTPLLRQNFQKRQAHMNHLVSVILKVAITVQKRAPLFSPNFISPDCETGHLRNAAQESAPAHHDATATPLSRGCKLRASSCSPAGEITYYMVMLQSHGLS